MLAEMKEWDVEESILLPQRVAGEQREDSWAPVLPLPWWWYFAGVNYDFCIGYLFVEGYSVLGSTPALQLHLGGPLLISPLTYSCSAAWKKLYSSWQLLLPPSSFSPSDKDDNLGYNKGNEASSRWRVIGGTSQKNSNRKCALVPGDL